MTLNFSNGSTRYNEAVSKDVALSTPKIDTPPDVGARAKPQNTPSTEFGSGWYHDAAIQNLKDVH